MSCREFEEECFSQRSNCKEIQSELFFYIKERSKNKTIFKNKIFVILDGTESRVQSLCTEIH